MYRRLQPVALPIAATLVLGGCLTCFFFPRQVGDRYASMKGLTRVPDRSADGVDGRRAAMTGIDCARLGRLDLALDQFSTAVALEPRNALFRYWRALVQLDLGDHEQYRRDCGEAVEQFAGANDALQPYLVGWACCLAPDAVADYSPVLRCAEEHAQAEPEWIFWRLIWGAALYRAGQYEQAIGRLTEAEQLAQESDASLESPVVYTWYFLAMAHHKLGHDVEAKKWLDKTTEWTDNVLRDHEEGAAKAPWNRRLTLKLLREEAEGMTGTAEGSKTKDEG